MALLKARLPIVTGTGVEEIRLGEESTVMVEGPTIVGPKVAVSTSPLGIGGVPLGPAAALASQLCVELFQVPPVVRFHVAPNTLLETSRSMSSIRPPLPATV